MDLRNYRNRTDCLRYWRAGLPTTSSLVESLVGEFHTRVKGRSKFWNRLAGVGAILPVRAVLLNENGRLNRFFAQRPGCLFRRHAA